MGKQTKLRRILHRLLCRAGAHDWIKSGGTRVGNGLFRTCPHCGAREQGFEERSRSRGRFIEWEAVQPPRAPAHGSSP